MDDALTRIMNYLKIKCKMLLMNYNYYARSIHEERRKLNLTTYHITNHIIGVPQLLSDLDNIFNLPHSIDLDETNRLVYGKVCAHDREG